MEEQETEEVPRLASFGGFRLLSRLGEGGMAEVFRAEMQGADEFRKEVALKLVHSRYSADPGNQVRQLALVAQSDDGVDGPMAFALSVPDAAPRESRWTRNTRAYLAGRWFSTDPFYRIELPVLAADTPRASDAADLLAGPQLSTAWRDMLVNNVIELGRLRDETADLVSTPWDAAGRGHGKPGVIAQASLVAHLQQGGGCYRLLAPLVKGDAPSHRVRSS